MPCSNQIKQTPNEFKGQFTDWLNCYVGKAFSSKDILSFVTYQPTIAEQLPGKVIEQTKKLFGSVQYVEVIEQTFESKKINNSGQYLDCYHSHLLMRKEDFNLIKERLEGFDIVEREVYDLNGLTYGYLVKQAGATHKRILPIRHIPIIKPQPVLTNEPIKENYVEPLELKILKVFPRVLKAFNLFKGFREINKIYWIQMFIDDT